MGMYSELLGVAIHILSTLSLFSLAGLCLPRALSKDPTHRISTVGHLPRADRTSFGTKRHTHHDPSAYRNYEACSTAFRPFTTTPEAENRTHCRRRRRSSVPAHLVRGLVVADHSYTNGWLWSFGAHIPKEVAATARLLPTATISAASLCIVLDGSIVIASERTASFSSRHQS
jgi:hypothetical protein